MSSPADTYKYKHIFNTCDIIFPGYQVVSVFPSHSLLNLCRTRFLTSICSFTPDSWFFTTACLINVFKLHVNSFTDRFCLDFDRGFFFEKLNVSFVSACCNKTFLRKLIWVFRASILSLILVYDGSILSTSTSLCHKPCVRISFVYASFLFSYFFSPEHFFFCYFKLHCLPPIFCYCS